MDFKYKRIIPEGRILNLRIGSFYSPSKHSQEEQDSWMWSLYSAAGISEYDTILDYGCGYAGLANFISGMIQNFKYYGMEIKGSESNESFENNKRLYSNDNRISLGYIGSDIEREALKESNIVILGSIFTHLKWGDFERVMAKFEGIIEEDGEVVFSVFLDDKYRVNGDGGVYGVLNCYALVYYTKQELNEFCNSRNYKFTEESEWLHMEQYLHTICKISKE